ncbi:PREDICTED: uncharacterized protein LOC107165886 isoform X1 [Diuraphis noxia]|uniref:uncharacterized protein LOC107165886 isoform X1 n=2 Tax=Diuraphis noxia TaxID=143948 RepID=UPI000763A0F3|nr:PREDICTED: uncharacterized protein LOC107165886 isoform X1 [Diuraphis noxia]
MELFKFLIVIFIEGFIRNVMSIYNPLLTYSLRFKKMSALDNITGNFSIDQYQDNQYINGYITINSKLLIDKVIGIFYRCDADGINCEYFQTWTLTDICPKLKDKNQIWSRWYGSFDPPMVCPIDKVHYRLINGTYDIDQGVRWYSDIANYQWKVTQKMYAGDVYIGSYVFKLSIFSYRKKLKPLL